MSRKFTFNKNRTIPGILHQDQRTFFTIISLSSSQNEKCFRPNL